MFAVWSHARVMSHVLQSGNEADYVVRVAALLRNPSSDISAPFIPAWWYHACIRTSFSPGSGK